jgi:hypothetical protein
LSLEQYKELKRNERNRLLSETDKYMLSDFPISDENREIVREYRLMLRDITENENWYKSELPRLELKTNL